MKVFNLGSYGNLNISDRNLFKAILTALLLIYDKAIAANAINDAAMQYDVDPVEVDIHCRRFMKHNNLQSA